MTPVRGVLGALGLVATAGVGLAVASGGASAPEDGTAVVETTATSAATSSTTSTSSTTTTAVTTTTIAAPPPTAPPASFPALPTIYRDRAYGGEERQRLDLFVPGGPGPHPVVAWLHGGGWQGGDKSSVPPTLRDALVREGIAVATLNYRLSGDPLPEGQRAEPPLAQYPDPLLDVKAAVRWLHEHAGAYALDADAVFLSGHSAGAALAVLAGTTTGSGTYIGPPVTLPGGDPPLRGVLAYAAPLDLALVQASTLEEEQRALRGFLGCPATGPCDTRIADARTYLDPADPPIALVDGSADRIVPTTHAASFRVTAAEVGYSGLTTRTEPGYGHSLVNDAPDTDFALGWIRSQLGG